MEKINEILLDKTNFKNDSLRKAKLDEIEQQCRQILTNRMKGINKHKTIEEYSIEEIKKMDDQQLGEIINQHEDEIKIRFEDLKHKISNLTLIKYNAKISRIENKEVTNKEMIDEYLDRTNFMA